MPLHEALLAPRHPGFGDIGVQGLGSGFDSGFRACGLVFGNQGRNFAADKL